MADITHRCYSRVGLLGNPSDGYKGIVISFSLRNFHAEVRTRAVGVGGQSESKVSGCRCSEQMAG
jgi:hypothetical protein